MPETEKLNARTRFVRHALFEPIDRPPYFETLGFWPMAVDRWHDEGLPRHVRHLRDRDDFKPGDITIEEYFDFESYSWPPFQGSATATPFWPQFEREVLEEDDEIIIFRDPSGVVRKDVKKGRSMPTFLEFPVKCREDWERLKPRLDPNIDERYEGARQAAAEGFNERETLVPMIVCGPSKSTCRRMSTACSAGVWGNPRPGVNFTSCTFSQFCANPSPPVNHSL